jgi:hypothetical protein
MRRPTFLITGLIFAVMASAQELPPGALLLSRVKSHLNEELRRLATVSCVETVHREQQPRRGKMRPLDTVRLEVLTNGEKELYASPGDRTFSEREPMSYVGSGMLGNGLFGLYLGEIVLNEYGSSQYKGEEVTGTRRLARYDYQISVMWSGQTVDVRGGSGKVGLHGSYWVDAQSYHPVRLELQADNIPPSLPITELTTRIDYGRTVLNDRLTALLPETADLRLVLESGEVSHNVVDFTHCRVFGAESTINFESPDSPEQAPGFATASLDQTLRSLPGGLQVAVKLNSRISGDMAVGTLVEGVVAGDVKEKRAVTIPAGSVVRGRIRRMERYSDPFSYFIVGLEFTEVEVQGIRYLFYADLVGIDPTPGVELRLSTQNTTMMGTDGTLSGGLSIRQTMESLSLYNLPGVAAFFYKGAKLGLPQDFRTVWKTLPLKP